MVSSEANQHKALWRVMGNCLEKEAQGRWSCRQGGREEGVSGPSPNLGTRTWSNGPVQAFQKKGAIYLGPRNGGTRRCTLKRYNVYKINQGQPERAESYLQVWLQPPLKAKLKALRKD